MPEPSPGRRLRAAGVGLCLAVAVGATSCSGDDDSPSASRSGPATARSATPASDEDGRAAVGALTKQGLQQLAAQDLDGAQATFTDVLALDPDDVYALYNLGYVAQVRGNEAGAVDLYTRAVAADKNFSPALYNLAILTEPDDLPGAVALYRRVLDVEPEDPATLVRLGFALQELGRTAEGERLRQRGIALDPSLSDVPAPDYG